jgi:hypothetical protein
MHGSTMRRGLIGTAVGLASLAGVAAPALAAKTQTIRIANTGKVASVTGAAKVKPGWTTFTISVTKGVHETAVFELKKGTTVAEITAAAAKLKDDPTPILKLGRILCDGSVSKGRPLVVEAQVKHRTYVVVNADNNKILGSFSIGTGHGGVAPRTTAKITLKDFKITSTALAPSGVVKVVNNGPSPHFVVAVRLKDPATAAAALAALKAGKDKVFGPLVDQTSGGELVGLISPGVINAVHYSGLTPGTYVLVCFYGDKMSHGMPHSMLGMETAVEVGAAGN